MNKIRLMLILLVSQIVMVAFATSKPIDTLVDASEFYGTVWMGNTNKNGYNNYLITISEDGQWNISYDKKGVQYRKSGNSIAVDTVFNDERISPDNMVVLWFRDKRRNQHNAINIMIENGELGLSFGDEWPEISFRKVSETSEIERLCTRTLTIKK